MWLSLCGTEDGTLCFPSDGELSLILSIKYQPALDLRSSASKQTEQTLEMRLPIRPLFDHLRPEVESETKKYKFLHAYKSD